jgi:hypothetical protein
MGLFDLSDLDIDGSGTEPTKSVKDGAYTYEFYPAGKVLVYKGEQEVPSYEVTPMGCTCPGDRYSSNPCKHRKMVSSLGDGSAVPPVEDTAVRAKETSDDLFSLDDLLA